MEQPATPGTLPANPSLSSKEKGGQKRKLPSPKEMIAHYESQGLETQEASIKVIDDLQSMLFRVVTSGRGKKDKLMADTSRKLDTANARLAILELKVDSKPGYAETLAIGVASGALFRGVAGVFPHVLAAVGQMWNAVTATSSTKG